MLQIKSLAAFVCLLAMTVLLGACANTRSNVSNGAGFASAGIAYVDAVPAILDESFFLTVEANSLQLALARAPLTEDERSKRLSMADEQLEQRLILLNDIRSHAKLLRSYFVALQALTAPDSAGGIDTAARDAVSRLLILRPALTESGVGKATISSLLEPGVDMLVGSYQNKALQHELAERGRAIERELALHKAVMSILVSQMQDDAQFIIQIKDITPVREAYVTAKKLSSRWSNRRVTKYKRSNKLQSLENLNKAATALHGAWIDFVEKRRAAGSWNLFIEDIEQMLRVVGQFSETG